MPTRVLALFLAIVLLWSGLSTIEAPRTLASPSTDQQPAIAQGGGQGSMHEGSVEHHHLDDQPSQAQSDPSTETPGLLPTPRGPSIASLVTDEPHALVAAGAGSPFLAGPLRPPCSAAVAG